MAITKAERQLAIDLTTADYGLVLPSQVAPIIRLAKAYQRIQEGWCNDVKQNNDPVANARAVKREEKLMADIIVLAVALPVVKHVLFEGDPRGSCVKLVRQDGRSNNMGGEGWGVL